MKRATTAEARDPRRSGGTSGVTLVELLIAITILAIVGAMLTYTWIALSDSFANTTRSSDARDFARQAASRMEREIRDAEAQLTTGPYQGQPAILWASANQIMFVTTFNDAGNDVPNAKPLAVKYCLQGGTLEMWRDANNDGEWDKARPISQVPYVVNGSFPVGHSTPVFSYTYIDDKSAFVTVHPTDDLTNLTELLRARIVSVTFTLLVDLNPGHSPTPMTFTTTAQLRNQREF